MPRYYSPRSFEPRPADINDLTFQIIDDIGTGKIDGRQFGLNMFEFNGEVATDILRTSEFSNFEKTGTYRLNIGHRARFDIYIQFPETQHPTFSLGERLRGGKKSSRRMTKAKLHHRDPTMKELAEIFRTRYNAINRFRDANYNDLRKVLDLLKRRKLSAQMAMSACKEIWINWFAFSQAPIGTKNNLWITGAWVTSAEFNISTESKKSFADYIS